MNRFVDETTFRKEKERPEQGTTCFNTIQVIQVSFNEDPDTSSVSPGRQGTCGAAVGNPSRLAMFILIHKASIPEMFVPASMYP